MNRPGSEDKNLVFQALADPTRRKILELLKQKDLTPGDMLPHFSMTRPSLSHHLDILKKANLVSVERSGQNLRYTLNVSVFEEVLLQLLEMFKPGKSKRRL